MLASIEKANYVSNKISNQILKTKKKKKKKINHTREKHTLVFVKLKCFFLKMSKVNKWDGFFSFFFNAPMCEQ